MISTKGVNTLEFIQAEFVMAQINRVKTRAGRNTQDFDLHVQSNHTIKYVWEEEANVFSCKCMKIKESEKNP